MSGQWSDHDSVPPNPYGFRDPRSVPGNLRGDDILIAARKRTLRRPRYQRWMEETAYWLRNTLANAFRNACDFVWRLTLGRWLWMKTCHGTDMTEVETMRMVSACTRIPVPRVWTHFVWRNARYIVMSRVRGVPLSLVWDTASLQFKEAVISQLTNYFGELRTLPTPYGRRICSISGGPVRDFRLQYNHIGPFEDEDDFNHRGARFGVDLGSLPASSLPHLVSAAHSIQHGIVFTHGDFATRNIMVDGPKVTAILDWECAGWFPEHWECCKSIFATRSWDREEWIPWLRRVFAEYELETEADSTLVKNMWVPLV